MRSFCDGCLTLTTVLLVASTATVGTWVSSLLLLLLSAACSPFSKSSPLYSLPSGFEHCCSYLWGNSQGLPLFLLLGRCHPSPCSPLVNALYFCTSFKIYSFWFSSFFEAYFGSIPLCWSCSPGSMCAWHNTTHIKSSWWGLFPWVERLKPSEARVLQAWGEFLMGVICRKWFCQWW